LLATDSSVQLGSSDPAFAGDDGFNGLPHADGRDGPDGAFLAQGYNVSTMICVLAAPSATIVNRRRVYRKSAGEDRAI
jgi:hypothetical protein